VQELGTEAAAIQLARRDWRDLQLLSQLAWMDEEYLARDPVVADLSKKRANFTEEDKENLRAKQLEFVDRYQAQRPKPGEPTRRYFIDGCHPRWGLDILYRCWLLRGQRFEVGVGGGRKRLNILGAICPEDREYVDLRLPLGTLSYQQVIALLQKLWQKQPQTKKFILYLDNARYQHARALKEWIETMKVEGVEFVLEHLPAYSPNLNLIERLWKFLRKHAMRKWHETFEAMQAAIASVLDNLDQYADELATLMTEKFHIRPAA